MAEFDARLIAMIRRHEGGFADDPDDRGGATGYGISIRFLRGLPDGDRNRDGVIDRLDVRALTRDEAIALMHREIWVPEGYGRIPSQAVARKVMDMAVNMGPSRAERRLQEGLVACGHRVAVDGQLGPQTLAAIAAADADWLLQEIRLAQLRYYEGLVERDPSQAKWLPGWTRRALA